jgi:hypothetical protein
MTPALLCWLFGVGLDVALVAFMRVMTSRWGQAETTVWTTLLSTLLACAGRSETDGDSPTESGSEASNSEAPPPDDAPAPLRVTRALSGIVCGVENTDQVAELACAYVTRECEILARCCGAPQTASACEGAKRTQCVADVRAQLEAGSCFDTQLFSPECTELYLDYQEACTRPPLLTAAFREEYESRCQVFWTRGNLAEGAACVWYSEQCAEPDANTVATCFPDFATNSSRPVCHLFARRFEGEACGTGSDSCQAGTRCNSQGTCEFPGLAGAPCELGFEDCESFLCVGGVCVDYAGRACDDGCGFGVCEGDVCRDRPITEGASCDFGALAD